MDQIREYFFSGVRQVDSLMRETGSPVESFDEVPQSDVDQNYHLAIGQCSTDSVLNGAVLDEFECKLTIYVGARNDDKKYYDRGYCKALEIRNQLVSSKQIGDNDFIVNAEPIRIFPSEVKSNYKVFIFEIYINVWVGMEI